jgi:hypothetical protein
MRLCPYGRISAETGPSRPTTVARRPARRLVERAERPAAIPPRSNRHGPAPGHGDETRPSTAQPLLPQRSQPHPTAHERHDRRAPSTSRRLPPSCVPLCRRHRQCRLSRRPCPRRPPRQTQPIPGHTATPLSAAVPPRVRNRPRLGCPTGLPGGSRKGVPCVSRGPPCSKAQAQNGKPPAGGAAACCSPGEQQLENNRSEQEVPVLPPVARVGRECCNHALLLCQAGHGGLLIWIRSGFLARPAIRVRRSKTRRASWRLSALSASLLFLPAAWWRRCRPWRARRCVSGRSRSCGARG